MNSGNLMVNAEEDAQNSEPADDKVEHVYKCYCNVFVKVCCKDADTSDAAREAIDRGDYSLIEVEPSRI